VVVPEAEPVGLALVVGEVVSDGAGDVEAGVVSDGLPVGLVDDDDVGVGAGSSELRFDNANAPMANSASAPAIAQNHHRL